VTFRIINLKSPGTSNASSPAPARVERSSEAHAALARANLPASADADAFMGVYDAYAEALRDGDLHMGAGVAGEVSRRAMPGRPDLALVRGRGVGGCSYVMAVRVPIIPQPARVEHRSWADETQDEIDTEIADEVVLVSARVPR
jgi:hypothetical protein